MPFAFLMCSKHKTRKRRVLEVAVIVINTIASVLAILEKLCRWLILEDAGGCLSTKKPAKLVFISIRGLFEMVVREGFEPPNGKPNGFTVHAL